MKKEIAFVCLANTSRSQMAEVFAKNDTKGCMAIYSAGVNPGYSINENVILVMEELGLKMDNQYPKKIQEIPGKVDVLVIMDPVLEVQGISAEKVLRWDIQDPVGKEVAFFRETRDMIRMKVADLVEEQERNCTV
ncbi:MAG: low molecular weight phosphatase family protein [Clostridia bacterium]